MSRIRMFAFLMAGLSLLVCASPIARSQDATADQPTIAKDSIAVSAYTLNSYHSDNKVWSWVPGLQFRVNGPISSGSQLWAEFKLPTGPWVKFDCKTEETEKGKSWQVADAGGRDAPGEDKGSTYTGPVDFTIHLRNELSGTDLALFSGKCKVAKAHSNETGPDFAQHFVYYVDQDWNLPIGYVFLQADDIRGMKLPAFNAAFWVRGDAVEFQPHLFYKDSEVGKISYEGEEVGKPSGESELDINTTHYVDDSLPEKARWSRVICSFPNVKAWNETGEQIRGLPGQKGSLFFLKDNPGEYSVKVLRKGKLARVIKFTVRGDGSFDDSISVANKLGDNRAIVPVQILGDLDGKWDHDAWKTDAFYGNPLKGFTAVP